MNYKLLHVLSELLYFFLDLLRNSLARLELYFVVGVALAGSIDED